MAKIMTVNKITWLILNDLLHMPCINKTMLRLVYILILDICVKDTKAIYKKKRLMYAYTIVLYALHLILLFLAFDSIWMQ